ncbi:hypothetical protein QAD02_016444 [Eretmocerus hayati]|uniref:Uncharacterized protein n=1 Tax=Eretmocerus hayati TaxID=131215 RepID=A0ACC2PB41_9HYME|nr:hypothetical protein QAD02_016444 [Eretmocerus hayati]
MEIKNVPESGAPEYIITPFSIRVVHPLASLKEYQAERHLPTQPSATFRQAATHPEISSSSAVGSVGRVAQFLKPDCIKPSSTRDQLSHIVSAKSDVQALF